MTTYIIIMVICLIGSAYFSATETAFSCANKTRLRALAEKGNKKAGVALALAERYDRLISTILIGNNIVNILLASLGTIVFTQQLGDEELGATVSTVVITVAVLILVRLLQRAWQTIFPKSLQCSQPHLFVALYGF